MSVKSTIRMIVEGKWDGGAALKKARSDVEETGSSFSKFSSAAVPALASAGTAALAFGVSTVKSFLGYEDSLTRLKTSLKDANISYGDNAKAIQGVIDANIVYGTKEDDTLALLNQGVVATGSLSKATDLLSEAQDIHAGSTLDLATAYTAALKGSEGNIKALRQMGIDLPVVSSSAEKVKQAFINLGTAQQNLKDVQEEVRTGSLKGKAARDAEKSAVDKLALAEQHYNDVASSGAIITAASKTKYKNQAIAQSKTIEGQLREEEARWDQWKAKAGADIVGVVAADERGASRLKSDFQKWDQDLLNNSVVDAVFGYSKGQTPGVNNLPTGALYGGSAAGGHTPAPGGLAGAPNGGVGPHSGGPAPTVVHDNTQHQANVEKLLKALVANSSKTAVVVAPNPSPKAVGSALRRWNKNNGITNPRPFRRF